MGAPCKYVSGYREWVGAGQQLMNGTRAAPAVWGGRTD